MNGKSEKSMLKDITVKTLGEVCIELVNVFKAAISRLPSLLAVCFALIALILVIAAIVAAGVAIFRGSELAIWLFFVILLMVLAFPVGLVVWEIRWQRKQIQAPRGIKSGMNGNTLQLADSLSESQKNQIREILQIAVAEVAEGLDVAPNLLRSNLFGKDDQNNMRMISDLTYNMNWRDEYTISMPVGYGSTGRCFSERKPNIAIFRKDWGKDRLEDEELKKVHPDLRWIISVPVLIGDGETPAILVMNVDGLKESPNQEELQKALGKLFTVSQIISLIISES